MARSPFQQKHHFCVQVFCFVCSQFSAAFIADFFCFNSLAVTVQSVERSEDLCPFTRFHGRVAKIKDVISVKPVWRTVVRFSSLIDVCIAEAGRHGHITDYSCHCYILLQKKVCSEYMFGGRGKRKGRHLPAWRGL